MGEINIKVIPAETGRDLVLGGGLEGAEKFDREVALWNPSMGSPDQIINQVKDLADARGRDTVQNDGYAIGAVQTHRDGIVGATFRLSSEPAWEAMGLEENYGMGWAEEFQTVAEARWNLIAESPSNWLDAARRMTMTEMVRLVVGGFVFTGEALATVEWIREAGRPCATALQLVSSDRLSNPDAQADTRYLRRGVEIDYRGRHIAYWIRQAHPAEWYDVRGMNWKRVPAEKPWGRLQVIYINEPLQAEQTRGVADMVAALKHLRMTKRFSEVTLQNAVINASYAAAIESELPQGDILAAMGGGDGAATGLTNYLGTYMTMLQEYIKNAANIQIDGAKIPTFFPGTKMKMQPMGTPGGVGSEFEASLLRKIAATLGVSYEELSRDYSKVSYSGGKMAAGKTERFFNGRKKSVADKFATAGYSAWLEEDIGAGNLPLPRGMTRDDFYRPLMREALSRCSWIGTGKGQIDEMKETQAAIMRIKSGLSTYGEECARLGFDFREVFRRRAREEQLANSYGLAFTLDAQRSMNDDREDKPGQNNQDNKDNRDNSNANS